MRTIAMAFICFAGLGVLGFWTLAIVMAVRSGKGFIGRFTRRNPRQWLSIAETIARYGEDHSFPN